MYKSHHTNSFKIDDFKPNAWIQYRHICFFTLIYLNGMTGVNITHTITIFVY